MPRPKATNTKRKGRSATTTVEIAAKSKVRALVKAAASLAVAKEVPIDRLRGIAFYDTERDAPITSLSAFDAARKAVIKIPNFITRFGTGEASRVVLQSVYEYFGRVDSPRYEKEAFEVLWLDFALEIQEANWMYRGIANVRNFTSEILNVDLGDGITIRRRNFAKLTPLVGAAILGRIAEDWSGFGASSFVVVAEHVIPKHPENVILIDSGSVWIKTMRAIGALRLAAAGDLSIGPMWVLRAARFNAGIGGISSVGASVAAAGVQYVWTEAVGETYRRAYTELAHLEKAGYGNSPGNLEIALRAFMGTYDRWPRSQDSQLLDTITALEALLGADSEIAFKLAFRVSGLLAASDNERGALLKVIKDFYDTRSRLVHGGRLKKKHEDLLSNIDQLRSHVRQLLRSLVSFAANPPDGYTKSFFAEHLDETLVDAIGREKLRAALGLIRSVPSSQPPTELLTRKSE